MKLSVLAGILKTPAVSGGLDYDIKGITYDSRQVKAGYLFCALPGQHQDGNQYIQDAIDRGAVAVISEQAAAFSRGQVVFIQVADARAAMAELAAAFYGHPAAALRLVGVTGTNGKTTTAFMIRAALADAGRHPGLIGTVQYEIGDRIIPASRTTPEATDLQNLLAQMVHVGCKSAVMEVSSHALVQKRVGGLDFDVAVFTNLTHDHLDYHHTLDEYFAAKSLLFRQLARRRKKPVAVVNLDDPYGQKLAAVPLDAEVITYGLQSQAMVQTVNLRLSSHGSVVDLRSPWGPVALTLKLLGRFNVSNALAALSAGAALGLDPQRVAAVLARLPVVPGRLEEIPTGRGFQVFVDYAHTEDALQNVLNTLREITNQHVIVVFGCGGNRDRKKRPLMAGVADRLADYTVVTSDNPRKENPSAIIAEICAGFPRRDRYEIVADRQEAIFRALSLAEPGDIVLIAGKGHENYQEFANTIIPFDDRQVVRECLGIKE